MPVVELPEPIYTRLMELAQERETTAAEVIAAMLPTPRREPTPEEIAAANAELFSHIVSLGYATGTDNEQIDADLVREYGDDHADLYRKERADRAA